MCDCGIFDSGLEGLVAADRRHGLDEEEGDGAGDRAKDYECKGRPSKPSISRLKCD